MPQLHLFFLNIPALCLAINWPNLFTSLLFFLILTSVLLFGANFKIIAPEAEIQNSYLHFSLTSVYILFLKFTSGFLLFV